MSLYKVDCLLQHSPHVFLHWTVILALYDASLHLSLRDKHEVIPEEGLGRSIQPQFDIIQTKQHLNLE